MGADSVDGDGRIARALALAADDGLQRELRNVRAKATLTEVLGEAPEYRWRYSPARIVRNVVALDRTVRAVAQDDLIIRSDIEGVAKGVAEAWESFAVLGERTERVSSLLYAAVAYELAGYQANAACLAKRLIVRNRSFVTLPSLEEVISVFLQRQLLRLPSVAEPMLRPPSEVLDEAELAERAADALVAEGLLQASRYMLSGEETWLARADASLALALEGFTAYGYVRGANVTSGLRSLLPVMKQRSTWVALNDAAASHPRWRRYLRLLARGLSPAVLDSRSVSELWPSQLAALEHGLLTDSASKVIKMPTSAGKTRVAELAIVHTLVTRPGSKCLYVAPFRALVNEVKDAFASLLSDLGYRASSVLGAYEDDEIQSLAVMEDDLLILTPEKLDLVLRLAPELVENVQLIVLDEGHIVGEIGRGAKYELLITRLKRKLPTARFLFLSAVLPEETLEDFANWLKVESLAGDIVVSGWRPSIQRLAALEWSGVTGTLRYASEDDQALSEFVPSVIEQRVFEHVNPQTGRINRPRFPAESNKSQIAAELAFELVSRGPILIFAVQPRNVAAIGAALARRIELAELTEEDIPDAFRARSSPAYEVASEWLGDTHDVTRLLHRGIALHHRQLPDAVKKAVEEDFRARRQQVVIATSTLAQGVNLPVRTVIVHSASRYNEQSNRQEPIMAREYWNIAGRAGRAGEETHGTIIHIVRRGNRQDRREFEKYRRMRQNVEPIESALFQLLLDLRDSRISDDEAASYLDAELLGILVEESVDFDSEDALVPLLGESLFSIQAGRREVDPAPLYRTFHGASRAIKERVGDESLLRLYAGTGLRSDSCEQIRSHVTENRNHVRDLLTSASITSVQALAQLFLEGLENIEEMQPRQEFTGSRLELLLQWIKGSPITELVEPFPDTEMAPETVAKLVEDLFSYRLPWGISGYLRIATQTLEIEQLPPTVTAFPAMVKYGVPTPAAAWATGAGIPSRQLAIDLAAYFITYIAQGESDLRSFRRWLAEIDTDQLREDFDISGPLLEEAARVLSQVERNDLLARIDEDSPLLPLTIEAPILRYAFRTGLIGSMTEGTPLEVHRDLDDRLNRNAMYLAINGERLCYLPRTYAQLLAPEVDTGLAIRGQLLQADLNGKRPTLTVEISHQDRSGAPSDSEERSNGSSAS